MSAHRSWRATPDSVSRTSRVVRWTSRVASSASSRATLRLTLDLGIPSARPAFEKLLREATLANTRRSLRSSIQELSHHGNNASTSREIPPRKQGGHPLLASVAALKHLRFSEPAWREEGTP